MLSDPIARLTSHVAGGGEVGRRAWVARITGESEQDGLQREYVKPERNLSSTGRTGTLSFPIERPGFYEYRGLGARERGKNYQRRRPSGGMDGFVRVYKDGTIEDLGDLTLRGALEELEKTQTD